MTAEMINDWEDVLYAYLEGRGLRADAEDLRLRLHLSADDRDEIEQALHLADEVSAAVRQPTPSIDLEDRLLASLRACPAPDTLPQGWASDGEGGFVAKSAAAAAAPQAEEDLLDAALEGGGSLEEILALRDRFADADFEAIEALVGEPPVPPAEPGMEARLRSKLRAFMESEAGEIDERIATRLLGGPRAATEPAVEFPDVLAAEENPPPPDGDPS